MTMNYHRSIGDDYPDYIDDELGYQYHAWEVISATESARLEAIHLGRDNDLDSLEASQNTLSDLERWALARRRLQQENRPAYFKLVTAIAQGPMEHRALNYPEVLADLSRRFAEENNFTNASFWADKIGEHWSELLPTVPLLKAHHLLLAGQLDDATQAYERALNELASDDSHPIVDLLIETAEDFLNARAFEQARAFLEQAQLAAQKTDDNASQVDIELLRQELDELSHP